MDLILWRHAQAERLSDGTSTEADLQRALTSKGQRQAERMAAWLEQRLPETCRILVSPATRTQQTAKALGRPFQTLPALAPGASVNDVLEAANWPNSRDAVLLVGHQPTLGQLAALLLSGQVQDWAFRKGGVWWIRTRESESADFPAREVLLQAVQSADFL